MIFLCCLRIISQSGFGEIDLGVQRELTPFGKLPDSPRLGTQSLHEHLQKLGEKHLRGHIALGQFFDFSCNFENSLANFLEFLIAGRGGAHCFCSKNE